MYWSQLKGRMHNAVVPQCVTKYLQGAVSLKRVLELYFEKQNYPLIVYREENIRNKITLQIQVKPKK